MLGSEQLQIRINYIVSLLSSTPLITVFSILELIDI